MLPKDNYTQKMSPNTSISMENTLVYKQWQLSFMWIQTKSFFFFLMFECPPSLLVSVSVDSIHEVCEGKKSEIFRRYADNRFDPNCCFSIYYGERVKSLNLVSTNSEEARTWITGLKYLMAGISDEDSLARRQRTRDQYP